MFPASFVGAQRLAPPLAVQIVSSSRIQSVPASVNRVKLTIQAPGGGGAGSSGANNAPSGSAGACLVKWLDVQPGMQLQIFIGAQGVAGIAGAGGNAGDTTVILNGATYTAGGGKGGSSSGNSFVPGGVATGGDLNINGGQSLPANTSSNTTVPGGASFFGAGSYGSGGAGGAAGSAGSIGGPGVVIMEY